MKYGAPLDHIISFFLAQAKQHLPRAVLTREVLTQEGRVIEIRDHTTGERWGASDPFSVLYQLAGDLEWRVGAAVEGLLMDLQDAAVEITREAWPPLRIVAGRRRLAWPVVEVTDDKIEAGYAIDGEWVIRLGEMPLSPH